MFKYYINNNRGIKKGEVYLMNKIGQIAILISMSEDDKRDKLIEKAKKKGFKISHGKVGTMQGEKIISSVMTAVKREGLWDNSFREEHALYDAIVEALNGICRGELAFGNVLRTVGLNFTVVRGLFNNEGEWIAVCFYGTIGAPIKGFEHEAIGLGINHI